MLRYACLSFVILGSFLVAAATDEEKKNLHHYMAESLPKCTKEFGLSWEDIEAAKKDQKLEDINPCFVACFFKSKKLIDDKGMFDPKEGYAVAEKFIKNPDELDKIAKITKICTSVNEEKVGDGDKGCERSELLIKCLVDNRSSIV